MRALGLIVLCVGCTSKAPANPDGGMMACTDKNPDGACYPTDNQGFSPRMGNIPGNRVPQMCFKGYKNLDPMMKTATSGPTEQICLSDFYDPMAKKYRIIRIIGSSYWCGPCRMEAEYVQTTGAKDALAKGAILLEAIFDEQAGTPATDTTLGKWNMETHLNITSFTDPRGMQLGSFSNANNVPWSVILDARSMEVLFKEPGFSGGPAFAADIDKWVTWTMNNMPQ